MTKKKKKQGHYCRICGEHKSNESFSGKGHTKHICKLCDALPQEKKNELQILNKIEQAGVKYPKSRQDWELLEKYAQCNKCPKAKELATFFLEKSRSLPEIDSDDDLFDDIDADIDYLPIFSEKKKFTQLDNDEKMILRDYIRSELSEHLEYVKNIPTENELIEMRKQMMSFFEEECHIELKKDVTLRKFFEDNAASMIKKLF